MLGKPENLTGVSDPDSRRTMMPAAKITATEVSAIVRVNIDMLGNGTCKVKEPDTRMQQDPLPSFLVKDEILTFVSGKFPLNDYTDCHPNSSHPYIFRKADGTVLTSILDSFAIQSTFAGQNLEGSREVTVLFTTHSGSNNPRVDSPDCSPN